MHIGFTGTRKGMTDRQKETLELLLRNTAMADENNDKGYNLFHHGDATGADTEAVEIAAKLEYGICAHVSAKNSEALLNRNMSIVDSCFLLIAAPYSLDEVVRSGTWHTIRYARRVGRPAIVLDP